MCEKPPPTNRSDLPEVPVGPTLRPRNILRHPRPLGSMRHSDTHLSRSVFNSQRATPSSPNVHIRGKEITSPRTDAKTIISNSSKQRKILSASFPKSLDTVPMRSKVTVVKSSTSSSRLPGSQSRPSELGVNRHKTTSGSAWTRHVHHKQVTNRPLVTTSAVKEGGNERNSLKEFDDVVSKNYEPVSDQSTQNGNMGYREKCLHWLLTLPD